MKRLVILFFLLATGAFSASAQVAVIAHKDVPADQLDARTIQAFYELEESKWRDNSRVVPFDLKDGVSVTEHFYAALGRKHKDFKKMWLRKKLSGEGQPPSQLNSDAEMIQKVAATPGALGFVSPDAVTDAVKVVATLQ